jgi:anti-sigma B factor antagonist
VAATYLLSIETRPAGIRLYLTGEVDMSVSDHLYQVLRDALAQAHGTVEVDLRGLRLLDCTGISALLEARDDGLRRGRDMFVSKPQGIVRRVLDLTDTLAVLTADPLPVTSFASDHVADDAMEAM